MLLHKLALAPCALPRELQTAKRGIRVAQFAIVSTRLTNRTGVRAEALA